MCYPKDIYLVQCGTSADIFGPGWQHYSSLPRIAHGLRDCRMHRGGPLTNMHLDVELVGDSAFPMLDSGLD